MRNIPKAYTLLALALVVTGEAEAQATATPTGTPSLICCSAANPWVPPVPTVSSGVAVDRARQRVYMTDRGGNNMTGDGWVKALNYDGSLVTSFGAGGSSPVSGAFQVAVGNGSYDGVYVLQRDNGAGVTKLDSNGNLVWSRSPAIVGSWRDVCVDEWGNVYAVTDSAGIIVWDNNGNQKSPLFPGGLGIPSGICAVGLDLYVTDTTNYRIVKFTQSGV
ncbi:MAG TPA: hypothetical protein VMV05_05620, partial [bacterium]|nr:hypothetical protein [bacterium]